MCCTQPQQAESGDTHALMLRFLPKLQAGGVKHAAPHPGTGRHVLCPQWQYRATEVSTGKDGPHRLGPLSQAFVFVVWVVGEGPSSAQLDSSQQLHAPSEHSLSWCVRATRFESVD